MISTINNEIDIKLIYSGSLLMTICPEEPSAITTLHPQECVQEQLASVAIIEDDLVMSEYLKESLDSSSMLSFCFSSETLQDGIEQLQQTTPTVLLLDLGLPDGSGIDIIRHIKANNLDTGVIVLTAFGDEKHVVEAISSGAVGYLLKDETHQSIETSILQMLKGGSPISPKIARDLLRYFCTNTAAPKIQPEPSSETIKLTKREVEILRKISKGFTCKEISEMECLSYHTITTHVRNIYKKLSVSSRAGAIFEAYNLRLI